jgi:hypothetical protein
MNRTKILEYRGKKIFFHDYSAIKSSDEIGSIMKEVKAYIHSQALLSVYSLASIEGMHFNNTIRDMFNELLKSNKPYVKASAIIGVTGLKQIVFNGIMKITGRDVKAFSNIEMAKDWLAQQN